MSQNKSVLSLMDTLDNARQKKREAERAIADINAELIEAILQEGAHDCLQINHQQLRRYFSGKGG